MKYINKSQSVVYVKRYKDDPTISVIPGEEVILAAGRSAPGLDPVMPKPKPKPKSKKKKEKDVSKEEVENGSNSKD